MNVTGRTWLTGLQRGTLLAALVLALLSPNLAFSKGLEEFSGNEVQSSDLKPFPKWTGTLNRYFDQKKLADRPCGSDKFNPCDLQNWQSKIASLQGKPLMTQVTEINLYLNKVRYVLDPVNWGVADYWSTPGEFFEVDGDCEDYAISKFISLRALGVPNDQMRIMIVQDQNLGGIIHSILAVKLNGKVYILDNQIPRLVEANSIYHYKPIYSINESAWWRH